MKADGVGNDGRQWLGRGIVGEGFSYQQLAYRTGLLRNQLAQPKIQQVIVNLTLQRGHVHYTSLLRYQLNAHLTSQHRLNRHAVVPRVPVKALVQRDFTVLRFFRAFFTDPYWSTFGA